MEMDRTMENSSPVGVLPNIYKPTEVGRQRRRKPMNVQSEHQRYDFLFYGDPDNSLPQDHSGRCRTLEFRDGPSLNGSKFHRGFQRRQFPYSSKANMGSTLQYDERRPVHTSPGYMRDPDHRRYYKMEYRNGDPILGTYQEHLDVGLKNELQHENPRRDKFLKKPFEGFTDALEREADMEMRNTNIRFFRDGCRLGKKCSVLGLGRNDMRSYGVADNFQFAVYDPNWRPLSPRDKPEGPGKSFDRRPRTCANKMESSCQLEENLSPRVMYTKTRRRYERDPDNVINPECDATLQPAIADKEKQHHRILKEIKKSQPVRPATRPKSLTRRAKLLEQHRRDQAKQDEISMVQQLPLP